jgi:hypothetical protein
VRQAALELVREVVTKCKAGTFRSLGLRLLWLSSQFLFLADTELLDETLVAQIKSELERAREDTSQLILIHTILTLLNEHSNAPPPSKRTRLTPQPNSSE